MAPLAQNGQEFGRQNNPNEILDECGKIDEIIKQIVLKFQTFAELQTQYRREIDPLKQNSTLKQIDTLSTNIIGMFRSCAQNLTSIKRNPESGSPKNAQQVGRVERKLKEAKNQYQLVEAGFRQMQEADFVRQYKIIRPDASTTEVKQALEDPSQPLFSQALLQSDRRGQSQSTMRAVESRHEAIKKIEGQMVELAQLFQDMDNLVVQQEAAVTNIEMKGEEVVEHMDKGTEQIGVAIKSARNARKWKWWCLGICGMSPLLFKSALTKYFIYSPHRHYRRSRGPNLQIRHPKQWHHQSQTIRPPRPLQRPRHLWPALGPQRKVGCAGPGMERRWQQPPCREARRTKQRLDW
jgi:syntaxin 1B/2/3